MRKKVGGFIKGEGMVVWPLDEGAIRVNYMCGGFGRWIFRDWISLVEDFKGCGSRRFCFMVGTFVSIAYGFLILFPSLVHTHVHFLILVHNLF